jgi:predicted PurR-regulated permease PerM
VILGVLAGAMGLIFAAPLAAVGLVMIQLWYVQDLLGDHETKRVEDA